MHGEKQNKKKTEKKETDREREREAAIYVELRVRGNDSHVIRVARRQSPSQRDSKQRGVQ